MGRVKPTTQSPKERASNFREVNLGFNKKISADESRRCPQCAQPTCLPACPLEIDIPGFIRFLRESDPVSALEVIKRQNPFPSICGRVCLAPCEPACVFADENSSISIRELERYASDFGQKTQSKTKFQPVFNGKRVTIIGSGPSAMMAAHQLLKANIKVIMYEAANQLGGLLRYGIAEFRLPVEIINEEYNQLKNLGLEVHLNAFVGQTIPLTELITQHDAVIIATGCGTSNLIDIKGENLAGVYYAQEFLMRAQLMSKTPNPEVRSLFKGSQTIIYGGGHQAIDVARVAVRLGQKVDIVFDGLEEQMDVSADLLKEALEEGVKVHTPFKLLNIVDDGKSSFQGITTQLLELVEGEKGLSLLESKEAPKEFIAQTLILSNGSRTNTFLSQNNQHLKLNQDHTFSVDDTTFKTTLEKVYAIGGARNQSMNVLEAFRQGKLIAKQLIEELK